MKRSLLRLSVRRRGACASVFVVLPCHLSVRRFKEVGTLAYVPCGPILLLFAPSALFHTPHFSAFLFVIYLIIWILNPMFLPADQIYRSWVVERDYLLALEELTQVAGYGIGLYLKNLPPDVTDESSAPIRPTADWKDVPARRQNGRAAPQLPSRRPLSWEEGTRR